MTASGPAGRPTVATAPGRVNLIGEHTDYNGGLCLPFALPLATTVRLTTREDDVVTIASRETDDRWEGDLDGLTPDGVTGWAAYAAGTLGALRDAGVPVTGCDLTIESDVPLGGGLSSSASLECAVAAAAAGAAGLELDAALRRRLALACIRAETTYVGAPTGGMDQLASMLGEPEHAVLIDFADADDPRTEVVPLPLAEAGLTVLVTDTRVRHQLSAGDGGYAQRRAEAESGDPRRLRHVASENERVRAVVELVGSADWDGVGVALSASHASLRDDYEVSTPELDLAAGIAVEAGALGARLTGGGFGGCTIALLEEGAVDRVRAAVDTAFAGAGHRPPAHHVVRPAAGARLA